MAYTLLAFQTPIVKLVYRWEAIGVAFIVFLCLTFGNEPQSITRFKSFLLPAFICASSIYIIYAFILYFIPSNVHPIFFELFFVSWTVAPKLISWKVLDARVAISSRSYFIFTHFTVPWNLSIIFTIIITGLLILAGKDLNFRVGPPVNADKNAN